MPIQRISFHFPHKEVSVSSYSRDISTIRRNRLDLAPSLLARAQLVLKSEVQPETRSTVIYYYGRDNITRVSYTRILLDLRVDRLVKNNHLPVLRTSYEQLPRR